MYIVLVFALYPAMMVDNNYIEIKYDLHSYMSLHLVYILQLFVLYSAMIVGIMIT